MRTLYLYDGSDLRAKFTAEPFETMFVTTCWNPDDCLEDDREVIVFESYYAALARMFELALTLSLQHPNLKASEVCLEECLHLREARLDN